MAEANLRAARPVRPAAFKQRALNLALRVSTLGLRFVLIALLARFLDAELVGYYGLFAAAIFYALLFFGLDFYVYTTRRIAQIGAARAGEALKAQGLVLGFTYLAFAPLALGLLWLIGMPLYLIGWFLPILLLEHCNQEIFRVLTVLEEQVSASWLLFCRQGAWVIVMAGLFFIEPAARNLETVLILWLGAGALAAIGGLYKLTALKIGGWTQIVRWGEIKQALQVSAVFLCATLALRAVLTFDRFLLEDFAGIQVVAAYVLFASIAASLNAFLDAAVYAFKYPQLLKLAEPQQASAFWSTARIMALQAIAGALCFAAVTTALMPWVLAWIAEPVYTQYADFFYWTLAASILFSWSMVPHYVLYARNRDRAILLSQLAGMMVFLISAYAIAEQSRLYAIPISVVLAMGCVLLCKSIACAYEVSAGARHSA